MLDRQLPHTEPLAGRITTSVPFTESHIPALKEIAYAFPEEFALTSTPANDAQAEKYFGTALADQAAGRGHPVVVKYAATGEVLGMSRLTEIHHHHKRAEIGFTWFHPKVFGTAVNVDSKLALLGFAFEELGLIRVQLHTDPKNIRSQRAILALGAHFEGIAKRHMFNKHGEVRDSLIYAITDQTWPYAKTHLLQRLERRLASTPRTPRT